MLVKLWDTKTGKVLFTLDGHGGKEVFFNYYYLQLNTWHCPVALGLYRLEKNENTVILMHMFYIFNIQSLQLVTIHNRYR